MRIRIAGDFRHRFVMSQPGRTLQAKEMFCEPMFFKSSPVRPWIDTMTAEQGNWLDVETRYLFEDQFNTETARVDMRYIDAIDFGPEFRDVGEFLEAVQKRYDQDWPGRKVRRVLENAIKQGVIRDETDLSETTHGKEKDE